MISKIKTFFRELKRNITYTNVKKALIIMKEKGPNILFRKLSTKIYFNLRYQMWVRRQIPDNEELERQKRQKFAIMPLISIIVPTFNTPAVYLEQMIKSVINQTYSNWELCIADGSDHEDTREILHFYKDTNKKINIKILEKNYGISGNTNEAISMARGEYIALFDHDDLLTPDALYEIVKGINTNNEPDFLYTDEDKVDATGFKFFDPHFKPGFAPDTLRSYNYICHLSVFRKSILKEIGLFRRDYDGSQDYDMILRLTEKANNIIHIPKILYHWRVHSDSVAFNPEVKLYAYDAAKKAINQHLKRVNISGKVMDGKTLGSYKIEYEIQEKPLISIIIPYEDRYDMMIQCINSIISKTAYDNYEIIIIGNIHETHDFIESFDSCDYVSRIKEYKWSHDFNYSTIYNYGISVSEGKHIILFHQNVKIITDKWIEELLMYSQREDIGAVGSLVYDSNDRVIHAGVMVESDGRIIMPNKGLVKGESGYFSRLCVVQNLSAVISPCMMIKRSVYDEIGKFDSEFKSFYRDIDFCIRARKKGYLINFTPFVEAYYYEGKGYKQSEIKEEREMFKKKWKDNYKDFYYNKNLTLK